MPPTRSTLSRRDLLKTCAALAVGPAGFGAGFHRPRRRQAFDVAARHAASAREAFVRSRKFVDGWLRHADPATGLIPRNLDQSRDLWNAHDSAADNYPFMVLTAALLDRELFEGRMRRILATETRLTSRIGRLPDAYRFSTRSFVDPEPDWERIAFGASEYAKDGLMPLTEWLGPSPWSARLTGMMDDLWTRAPLETPYGRLVTENVEVNGELLQVLSRIYWMTGEPRYLDWAVRLGDYYLLGSHHPTRDHDRLRLRDHGCEFLSGLCELYATVHYARPEKRDAYRAPLHAALDRVLEVGRTPHGLFYNVIDPQTGEVIDDRAADTWGYTFNGYYTVYLIDGVERYREAVLKALDAVRPHYTAYDWERGSADGYADTIESALNLLNREPHAEAAAWVDAEIPAMWAKQQPDGVIEGWHGDGNFARTSMLYGLWKTQGLHLEPWREDLLLGAAPDEDGLAVYIAAERPWRGRLRFDTPRHRLHLHLPLDWPRINQFPEWFTVGADQTYRIDEPDAGQTSRAGGRTLSRGLALTLEPGRPRRMHVGRISA